MALYQVLDAANPPAVAPDGFAGVLGYLNSARASRPWTIDNWDAYSHLRQFPVYVADVGTDPEGQAQSAVRQVLALGWAARMPEPQTRAIIFDLEDTANRAWYARAAQWVVNSGFVPVCYGSLSTVLDNAAADVLAAAWDGMRVIPAGQTIHGHQWAAGVQLGGATVDLSLFDDWLINRGGTGPRK